MDLGTTNSAVAYVDTLEEPWQIRSFAVPQLVAPFQVEPRDTLPSFHYQSAAGELAADALRLPWSKESPEFAVGMMARDHGSLVPGRQISSAKSWLCHTGVDRTADLLPWQGAADVERLSPIEVSARYLRHVREAWDRQFPSFPLAEQDFVLTLPASFDEVARELTIEAAARAGLPRVVLIEEPQAAFYAWIDKHSSNWQELVSPGQKILVCDIGGGTTDFTLIRVRAAAEGKVQFHRVAVGDHLILAGDNLDLALARHLEEKIAKGGQLEARQWDLLVRSARGVKESLLGEKPPEKLTVNLSAGGSRLLGGGLRTEVTRDEVRSLLLDGFFPSVTLEDRPAPRRSGFQEFGLPYAPDPAITKYLAKFLTDHRHVAVDDEERAAQDAAAGDHDPARPDVVLFNGGVFESPEIRRRLIEVLEKWFRRPGRDANWTPLVLENERLDLAVARGAAYYGMVRRGVGVRIAAELARTYYLGIEGAEPMAVCLVPAKAQPGEDIDLPDRRFHLLVATPVDFPLYSSSVRLVDRPGDVVPVDREQLTPLAPIRTVLRTRKRGEAQQVEVTLHARLTEIGTVELWCSEVGSDRSWRLQFDVRAATQTDLEAHGGAAETAGFLEESVAAEVRRVIERTFGEGGKDPPAQIAKQLAAVLEMDRWDWPPSLLRQIWQELMDSEGGRRRSPEHEARWLNLLGFSLRPGYGLAVDDWRVATTWRTLTGKMAFGTPQSRTEWWILWRRIAGGLTSGQQRALADPLLGPLRAMHRKLTSGKGGATDIAMNPQESIEVWRLLGSLELLPVTGKIELGNLIVDLLPRKKLESLRPALIWALGRIGARVPVYGPLNAVVPAEVADEWLGKLLTSAGSHAAESLAVMQLARRTDDRYRDLREARRQEVIRWMSSVSAPEHLIDLVRKSGQLDSEEAGRVVGEALPKGLRVVG